MYANWHAHKFVTKLKQYREGSNLFIDRKTKKIPPTKWTVEIWLWSAKPKAAKMGSQ